MLLLLSLACSGTAPTCDTLAVDACADDEACTVIDASAITVEDTCYTVGESEGVGCMAADIGCDDAITYAGPGDGTCFEFPNGCVPAGWAGCEPPGDACEE